MRRKVIQLAHKTLVVSLPSKWVQHYGVQKGAELDVEERGAHLLFSPLAGKKSSEEQVQVDVTGMDAQVLRRWLLASLHKIGYDEVEILYKDVATVRIIEETIREILIGFAIVEQGKNRCVMRIVAQEQEKEFDSILRRAFLVTKGMGESIADYLREGKISELSDLLVLEKTNNQLTNFCERILNKRGYRDEKRKCFLYVVVWNLEKICDHYKEICTVLIAGKEGGNGSEAQGMMSLKARRAFLEMVEQANRYFAGYYELFYAFDMKKLTLLHEERRAFRKKIEVLLADAKGSEALLLCSLNEMVTKTSDFSASFIALNL